MRSRLLRAALFAFVLAFAVPLQHVEAGSGSGLPADGLESSSSASASSGGCLPPSAAVDMYLFAGSEDAFRIGAGTEAACEKICDKFVDTCDRIAKISRNCQNRGGGKYAQLLKATCSTFDDKQDRKSCKADVEYGQDIIKQCTGDDRDRAGGCCENHRAVCIYDCLDEGGSAPNFQACFTGPGGYAGGSCWFSIIPNPS